MRSLLPTLLLGVGAAFCAPMGAAAQQGDGFLFGRPWLSLGVSFGYASPNAGSEVFDFTREQLRPLGSDRSIDRGDYGSPVLQGELAVRLTERFDMALGLGWSESRLDTEDDEFIGTDDLPIVQTTTFSRVPLTLGVKAFLFERGRELGRFAWVPARWSPYVGAGVGGVWHEFVQAGEFVDYQTFDIFEDRFVSAGWAPTAHVRAGSEVSLGTRLVLTADGRYAFGSAEMGRDFVDFDDIDLSGFQATLGLSLRF